MQNINIIQLIPSYLHDGLTKDPPHLLYLLK